jgi:membrane associated rhomboid family serine protease
MSLQYEKSEEVGNFEENEPQITPEEYLEDQKSAIRQRAYWFLAGGGLITVFLLLALFAGVVTTQELFRSIFFILGLFGLVGGVWGIYYARKLTLKDLIPTPEAIDFIRQGELSKPYFSYVLVACLIAVALLQMLTDLDESIDAAGFIKPHFLEKNEYWRILTGGVLHGGILHLYFNGQALYGFGSLIESISNRAHLAIVFLLAIIGGGIVSLIFMPEGTTVGASGGVMGLIGYLAIYGYRRKRQLPPDFLKSMLINVGFITAFGIVAYQIVDNFAHLGGLITGAGYGFVQIPKDLHKNPREVSTVTEIFSLIALGIFIFTCILSILLMLKLVRL